MNLNLFFQKLRTNFYVWPVPVWTLSVTNEPGKNYSQKNIPAVAPEWQVEKWTEWSLTRRIVCHENVHFFPETAVTKQEWEGDSSASTSMERTTLQYALGAKSALQLQMLHRTGRLDIEQV